VRKEKGKKGDIKYPTPKEEPRADEKAKKTGRGEKKEKDGGGGGVCKNPAVRKRRNTKAHIKRRGGEIAVGKRKKRITPAAGEFTRKSSGERGSERNIGSGEKGGGRRISSVRKKKKRGGPSLALGNILTPEKKKKKKKGKREKGRFERKISLPHGEGGRGRKGKEGAFSARKGKGWAT